MSPTTTPAPDDVTVPSCLPSRRVAVCALLVGVLAALPARASAQDPAVLYISGFAVASVVPGLILDWPALDRERAMLKMGVSRFDAMDAENEAWDFTLEYRPAVAWRRIKPLVGVSRNSDGSMYSWLSGSLDLHVGTHLVANLNTGPAFYFPGNLGKELGSFGVLRSGFEVGVRFQESMRTTVSFHHMSHGKLMNRGLNPGTETVGVGFWWTVG